MTISDKIEVAFGMIGSDWFYSSRIVDWLQK